MIRAHIPPGPDWELRRVAIQRDIRSPPERHYLLLVWRTPGHGTRWQYTPPPRRLLGTYITEEGDAT